MRNPHQLISALLISLFGTAPLTAQPLVEGNVRTYQGITVGEPRSHLANRSHLGLQTSLSSGPVRWFGSATVAYDATDRFDARLRELYGDARLGAADLRFGRFPHSFGRAEGMLMGDIHHTYDLSEFLTLDPEDLRSGTDGLRLSTFAGRHALRLLVSPFRSRNRLPGGDWELAPSQVSFIPVTVRHDRNPAIEPGPLLTSLQMEWRPRLDLDVDLALSRWHEPLHSYRKTVDITDTPFGPVPTRVRLRDTAITGLRAAASAEYRITPLMALVGEWQYVAESGVDVMPDFSGFQNQTELADALRAENERGYLRTTPKTAAMFGSKTVLCGYTLSSQVFIEHRLREPDRALGERTVGGITASAWKRFLYDDLLIRIFGRYQGKPGSWWIQPESAYRIRDNLQVRVGAHWFGGDRLAADDPSFSFDRYRRNRFVYGKLRYTW